MLYNLVYQIPYTKRRANNMCNFCLNDDEMCLVKEWALLHKNTSKIDNELYQKHAVKRGLRNQDGRGVLAGLTRIGEVQSYYINAGDLVPKEGKLIYRGIDINDLTAGFISENRFGFEETAFLLNFGKLPSENELASFKTILSKKRKLPEHFVRDTIMRSPSKNMLNVLAKSVLALYSYDDNADDTSLENLIRQSIELIARFPLLAVYGYNAYRHYHGEDSFIIHNPDPNLSTAENILKMLRFDSKYTDSEAKLLDLILVLHAEHGGGNNSSFTTHVVSSSGTDTYSVIASALGSLKGPKHGGANKKVSAMFRDIKENVKDLKDEDELKYYLNKILDKQAFDNSGLIYGIGHAVYTISDPRTEIFKKHVKNLAKEKGLEDTYNLYATIERLAPELIYAKKNTLRKVSANVDFYSGFAYSMLGIPEELFTPLFAVARITGWCAHRMEEVSNDSRLIRPAYRGVERANTYIKMKDRNDSYELQK